MKSKKKVLSDGTVYWETEMGQLHRTDGPAVIYPNGSNLWYYNGKRHRTDGPAIECTGGHNEWWYHDKRHRTDGPAVELSSGEFCWWYRNQYFNNPKDFPLE